MIASSRWCRPCVSGATAHVVLLCGSSGVSATASRVAPALCARAASGTPGAVTGTAPSDQECREPADAGELRRTRALPAFQHRLSLDPAARASVVGKHRRNRAPVAWRTRCSVAGWPQRELVPWSHARCPFVGSSRVSEVASRGGTSLIHCVCAILTKRRCVEVSDGNQPSCDSPHPHRGRRLRMARLHWPHPDAGANPRLLAPSRAPRGRRAFLSEKRPGSSGFNDTNDRKLNTFVFGGIAGRFNL